MAFLLVSWCLTKSVYPSWLFNSLLPEATCLYNSWVFWPTQELRNWYTAHEITIIIISIFKAQNLVCRDYSKCIQMRMSMYVRVHVHAHACTHACTTHSHTYLATFFPLSSDEQFLSIVFVDSLIQIPLPPLLNCCLLCMNTFCWMQWCLLLPSLYSMPVCSS